MHAHAHAHAHTHARARMHTHTHTHTCTCTHTHTQVGMLEEDVLVGQTRRKRGNNIEKSHSDLEAAVRDTQLACLMASGENESVYTIN